MDAKDLLERLRKGEIKAYMLRDYVSSEDEAAEIRRKYLSETYNAEFSAVSSYSISPREAHGVMPTSSFIDFTALAITSSSFLSLMLVPLVTMENSFAPLFFAAFAASTISETGISAFTFIFFSFLPAITD